MSTKLDMKTDANRFTWIAPIYDFLADTYSLGQISKSKLSQLKHMTPGDTILFAGAGNAVDAIAAAKAGMIVTVVELSPNMMRRAQASAEKVGLREKIEWRCQDVFAYEPEVAFDTVVANYFLNVFPAQLMPSLFDALLEKLRPGGRFMLADFAPQASGRVERFFQSLYFFAAVAAFHLIAGNAWHPLYDYAKLMRSRGLNILAEDDFHLARIGPAWYRSTIAERVDGKSTD
jgi:ubiquinone/menaquinone biosynthesis C-methylase UbiE